MQKCTLNFHRLNVLSTCRLRRQNQGSKYARTNKRQPENGQAFGTRCLSSKELGNASQKCPACWTVATPRVSCAQHRNLELCSPCRTGCLPQPLSVKAPLARQKMSRALSVLRHDYIRCLAHTDIWIYRLGGVQKMREYVETQRQSGAGYRSFSRHWRSDCKAAGGGRRERGHHLCKGCKGCRRCSDSH